LSYDAENRLVIVSKDQSTVASFVYDGDGRRVKSVLTTDAGDSTTYFVGNYYEVTDGVVTKYYYAGTQRIAMRKNNTLYFMLGDHLGSTSLVTSASGLVVSQTQYKAWGEVRHQSGTQQTSYGYTGQYSYAADFGLMYYNARWYDPGISEFTSPDTLIPNLYNSADWNRYGYARYNPLKYTDPSGHCAVDGDDRCSNNGNNIKISHNSSSWYLVELEQNYNWTFEGSWTNAELKKIYQVAIDVSSAVGGVAAMLEMFGAITFDKKAMRYGGLGEAHHITLNEASSQWDTWSVAHELGHAWDGVNERHQGIEL